MNAKKLKTLRSIVKRVARRENLPYRQHVMGTPGVRAIHGGIAFDGTEIRRLVQITGTITNSERSTRGLYRYAKAEAARASS